MMMMTTILPNSRTASVSHRLNNAVSALGSLGAEPHNQANLVSELRRCAADLQRLAVEVLAEANRVNDAKTVSSRLLACSMASGTLQDVLGNLR
jgi:hypothetical protein